MHTVGDQHPTRRKGEANYRGANTTRLVISPGRRRGEPNHLAWTKFKGLNLVAEAMDQQDRFANANANANTIDGNTGGDADLEASGNLSDWSENTSEMLGALSNSLANLHSVIEALPDLTRLLNLLTEKGRDGGFGVDHPGRRKGDRARNWTIADAVEIHNLCSETRRMGRNGPEATSRYQNRQKLEDDNILPPTYPFWSTKD